jgi:pimeloyl-ACP methyl ester carboxylesterase
MPSRFTVATANIAGLLICLTLAGCESQEVPTPLAPLTPIGTWEGAIVSGWDSLFLRVALRGDSAAITGTIDAPDYYALSYPLDGVSLSGRTIRIRAPDGLFRGVLEGTLERGSITGTFRGTVEGATASAPSVFVDAPFHLSRGLPVTLPYRTEEVVYRNGKIALHGTLMISKGRGRHPAVVFLHGSGPQTRDSYIRYFADALARRGVAAFIYDKRNMDRVDLPPYLRGGGSFSEYADDAAVVARELAARKDIDPSRIGVWGLSQGAWLGPLAASRSPNISFAILLSGGGVTPAEQELYDDEVKLRAHGVPEPEIRQAIKLLELADLFARTGADRDWTVFQSAFRKVSDKRWFVSLDKFPLVLPREAPVWRDLRTDMDYNPIPALEKLTIPTLVILGENDMSTPSAETARRMEAAFRRSRNRDYRILTVRGADHALRYRPTRPARIGPAIWLRPTPGWVEEMTRWIVRHSLR